jgi:5'-nucleotidase (lipoprotein e(P4) family)
MLYSTTGVAQYMNLSNEKSHGLRVIFRRACAVAVLATVWSAAASAQTTSSGAKTAARADNGYQTGAALWQQSSGEARALQYQAFALARLMLDRDLRTHRSSGLKRAVVVDVDETVLDNSRFQAGLIVNGEAFNNKAWIDWCNSNKATAIPGAVEFLRYASSRGVRVFYVTNRGVAEKAGTITNLKQQGFPGVSEETLVVRTDASSKEPRRKKIRERYRIVLLCGDNLADFSDIFGGTRIEERNAAVDAARWQFGTQFIVLPNPMYGDWENAVYGFDSRLSEQEKAARRKAALKTP